MLTIFSDDRFIRTLAYDPSQIFLPGAIPANTNDSGQTSVTSTAPYEIDTVEEEDIPGGLLTLY